MIRAIKSPQTAEVRVKTTMRAQRVRDAGSRAEMQMVTMGHRGRGESGMAASIPRRRRQALSGREYVGTLLSVRQFFAAKQGGTAVIYRP